jgi:hypothetical protein
MACRMMSHLVLQYQTNANAHSVGPSPSRDYDVGIVSEGSAVLGGAARGRAVSAMSHNRYYVNLRPWAAG